MTKQENCNYRLITAYRHLPLVGKDVLYNISQQLADVDGIFSSFLPSAIVKNKVDSCQKTIELK
jgi:hypothetical protein